VDSEYLRGATTTTTTTTTTKSKKNGNARRVPRRARWIFLNLKKPKTDASTSQLAWTWTSDELLFSKDLGCLGRPIEQTNTQ
jgi:hypothetical protein